MCVIKLSDVNIQCADFIFRYICSPSCRFPHFKMSVPLNKQRKMKNAITLSKKLFVLGRSALLTRTYVRNICVSVFSGFSCCQSTSHTILIYSACYHGYPSLGCWNQESRDTHVSISLHTVPEWLAGGGRRAQTAADGQLHTFANIAAPAVINTFVRAVV